MSGCSVCGGIGYVRVSIGNGTFEYDKPCPSCGKTSPKGNALPNEVKQAISRVKVRTSLGRCNIAEVLTALANEDEVMRLMGDVFENNFGAGNKATFIENNMRAAVLALAKECEG